MIDSGATHSPISQRALAILYHAAIPSSNRIAQLGDGHTALKILDEFYLLLQFNQVFTPLNVLVVKTLNTDFILGADSSSLLLRSAGPWWDIGQRASANVSDLVPGVFFLPI